MGKRQAKDPACAELHGTSRQQVAAIAAGNFASVLAAKAAVRRRRRPVRPGLIASLARPDGNLTGINFFNIEVTAKRLELLHELVPGAARVAVLVNPTNPRYRDHVERRGTGCSRYGAATPGLQRQYQRGDRCGRAPTSSLPKPERR